MYKPNLMFRLLPGTGFTAALLPLALASFFGTTAISYPAKAEEFFQVNLEMSSDALVMDCMLNFSSTFLVALGEASTLDISGVNKPSVETLLEESPDGNLDLDLWTRCGETSFGNSFNAHPGEVVVFETDFYSIKINAIPISNK